MLTIFCLPKPFEGHIGVIQRNAIRSWRRLGCDVLICGNEIGCREVAVRDDCGFIPDIKRNDFGTPLVSSAFEKAQERATGDLVCYANADLILFSDFKEATERVASARERFLMVGEAWNIDINEEIVEDRDWDSTRQRSELSATRRGSGWMDYFAFRVGTIGRLPDFAVGRPAWDNWMIWHARRLELPVIDISPCVRVLHQRHDYRHVKAASGELWSGPEADGNRALTDRAQWFSLEEATHRLHPHSIEPIRASLSRQLRTRLALHPWTRELYGWLVGRFA